MFQLLVCDRVAELYPKNYMAWTHRQWVVEGAGSDVLSDELMNKRWTNMHVSGRETRLGKAATVFCLLLSSVCYCFLSRVPFIIHSALSTNADT